MCGIYGFLDRSTTGIYTADWAIISQMAKLTELRGEHSSGMFAISKEDKVGVHKVIGDSKWLIYDKGFNAFDKKFITNGKALIGHGRYATVGKVTKQNAHPFREGHITLVHNGTIRGGLAAKDHNVEVDSHALCVQIAKVGLKEAISDITGAWAIIMHDANENKIHILRNYERDLHYAKGPFGVYIMSEKQALEYLLARNNMNNVKVEPFAANKLYTYDVKTKEFTEEGEHIQGNYNYGAYVGKPYGTPPSGNNGGLGKGEKRTYKVPTIVDSKAAADMQQVYEVGDLVEFNITDYTIINGNYHYRAHDSKGNEFRFMTGNVKSASQVKTGDAGIGEVVGFQLDYVRRVVTYRCRFREIAWSTTAPTVKTTPQVVHTRGGETFTGEEWEAIAAKAQCFSCCGRLDPDRPDETVVVDEHRVFCPDCVDDYLNSGNGLNAAVPGDLRKFIN
jgi:hypothetical protein